MQLTRYVALMSGGVELPPESGLGRVATPVLNARVEGRWLMPATAEPVYVDGLGLAEEPDGPLVAVHHPVRAMHVDLHAGDPLFWSVHLSSFRPVG